MIALCDDEIPYDDKWERSGDSIRHEFQVFDRDCLNKHHISFIEVMGTVEERKS
jgi:hypothetical protein